MSRDQVCTCTSDRWINEDCLVHMTTVEEDADRQKITESICDDCPSTTCGKFGDYGKTPSVNAKINCAALKHLKEGK